jgi:hypothetical protein
MPFNYPLREFAFFDRQKVVDFTSAIEGGLSMESHESLRTGEKAISGEIGVPGMAKLEVSRGVTRHEFEETRTQTDASLFERLHSYLVGQKLLKEISSLELDELDLIEAEVDVDLSGKDQFLEMVDVFKEYLPVMQVPGSGLQPQVTEMLRIITQSAAKQGITLVMNPKGHKDLKLVTTLPQDRERLRVTKEELRGKYRVLGRVLRVLKPGEKIDLFNLLSGITLPRDQLQKMIESQPSVFSTRLTEESLSVSYPAVEMSTVALFR